MTVPTAASITAAATTSIATGTQLRIDQEWHTQPANIIGIDAVREVGALLRFVQAAIKAAGSCTTGLYIELANIPTLLLAVAAPGNATYAANQRVQHENNQAYAAAGVLTAMDMLVPGHYPVYTDAEVAQFNMDAIQAWQVEHDFSLSECRELCPQLPISPALRTQFFAGPAVNQTVSSAFMRAMLARCHETCASAHIWGQSDLVDGYEYPMELSYDLGGGAGKRDWTTDLSALKSGRW
jgi:hypothetical protein